MDVLTGTYWFVCDGIYLSDVRRACVEAVSSSTGVPEQYCQCVVSAPLARRLSAMRKTQAVHRRLQELWNVAFSLRVPKAESAIVADALRTATQVSAPTEDAPFGNLLREALLESAANDTIVLETFSYGELVVEEDAGGVAGLQQSLSAQEALVLSILLDSNATEVSLEVGGYQAVAKRVQRSDVQIAGGASVTVGGDYPVEAKLPSSLFDDLSIDEAIIVAISLGDSVNAFAAANDDGTNAEQGVVEDVQGSVNLNLFSGEGGAFSVSNLTKPILITMIIQDAEEAECMVWSEDVNRWSSDGLTKVDSLSLIRLSDLWKGKAHQLSRWQRVHLQLLLSMKPCQVVTFS